MSQQITASTLQNKIRLRILSARQQLLDTLYSSAAAKLPSYADDAGPYQQTCKGLILEGCYALNEKKVLVRCREKDGDVVRRAAEEARAEYVEALGKEVEITVDEKERLPEES